MPRHDSATRIPGTRPRAAASILLLAAATALATAAPAAAQAAPPDRPADASPTAAPDFHALWEAGARYDAFLDGARGRRDLWERNTARAAVPGPLLDRARAVPGSWRLLVIALDRCSDSVSTLPWLAALADSVATLELRIVPPDAGRAVMEAHRTPDGRAATPTAVVLDDDWSPAGVWVERPSELQRWFLANPEELSHDERHRRKMAWYDDDAGLSTLHEIISLLEAAARPTSDR